DENLWIASRLICFDQPRALEKFSRCSKIQITFKATGSEDKPHRLLQSGLDHNPKIFFFQKATNNKKQFQRLPASENNIQKFFKTETQGINAMQLTDALRFTSFLLKKATVKDG
ncbi:hypothetical protein STEG23_025571, partial [Scotinomys teguina]